MNKRSRKNLRSYHLFSVFAPLVLVLWLALSVVPGRAASLLGSAITYQGEIHAAGEAVTGECDLDIELFDDAIAGSRVGLAVSLARVAVVDGVFSIELDFGAGVFDAQARWLEVAIRCPAGVGPMVVLRPRTPLTPAPFAHYSHIAGVADAVSWSGVVGLPAGFADNIDDDTTYGAGAGLKLVGGSFAVDFAGSSGSAASAARSDHHHDGDYLVLTGGALSGGLDISGSVSMAGFRLPGGAAAGSVLTSDGDGNGTWEPPQLSSGGWRLTGNAGTQSGTDFIGTTDDQALEFRVEGQRALLIVPDGGPNRAPNIVGGSSGTEIIVGSEGTTISGGGFFRNPQVQARNRATDSFGTIGGGQGNTVGNDSGTPRDALGATVAGGSFNQASALHSTVGGGEFNRAMGSHSTIAGGGPDDGTAARSNTAFDDFGSIGGGAFNRTGTDDGTVQDTTDAPYGTIGGGFINFAPGAMATVAGGLLNQATGVRTAIGGGKGNVADGDIATISGGSDNEASGFYSTISGGEDNRATESWSSVSGGQDNQADGRHAIVSGGSENLASGDYSFAAGRQARALHRGSFVWADASLVPTETDRDNQFLVKASGGAVLTGASGTQESLLVYNQGVGDYIVASYGPGYAKDFILRGNGDMFISGTLSQGSDRDRKTNIMPVDPAEILALVAAIDVSHWHYTSDPTVRHIGPMAQDFYAAFNVGADEKHIAAIDADGVNLAAIQALYQRNLEYERRLESLEARMLRLVSHCGPHLATNVVTRFDARDTGEQ